MRKPLSIKQFNEYIKSNIKHDPIFQRVYLRGELCNIKVNNNHLYFSLKEGSEIIDAVIYYFEDKEIDFKFTVGKEVLLRGNLSYNNYSSRLVIVASKLEDVGLSKEYQNFIKMKEEFKAKGYFDKDNKKDIPKLVKTIGLITSRQGAAIIDFLAMINSKANDIHIYLVPVKVQGSESEILVSDAIDRLDTMGLDVLVITRGGGSNEDLSTFNKRKVIESVFKAKTPVISAVGHNIDTNLIDYTSDLSLQTPTEAGSYLISNYIDYDRNLKERLAQAKKVIDSSLLEYEHKAELIKAKLDNLSPNRLLSEKQKNIESLDRTLDRAIKDLFTYKEDKIIELGRRLDYTEKLIDLRKEQIEVRLRDKPIYSSHSLKDGDEVIVKFSDGLVKARIING